MVINFNKEMFFQLSCFWPPQEVKRFAEAHGLLTDLEEKRSRSIGKKPEGPPKNPREMEGPPKKPRGQAIPSSNPKPKAASGIEETIGPPKPSRGNVEKVSKLNLNQEAGLKRGERVLSQKKPAKKTLADVAKGKSNANPFEDDPAEASSAEASNPFLDEGNPFEEKEASNPFLEDEPANPFLDEDEGNEDSGNPFLD